MKRKWWPVIVIAFAAAISLCFFGVRLCIAPRLILSRALSSAMEQVDNRFANSPANLLAEALDNQLLQQAKLKLETENKHLGPVVYDMTLRTQLSPNRIFAEGSVIGGGRVLDLSLFLNEDFAAASSESLVDGQFYGINFDTFSDDIRHRQILAALIGENTISGWEAAVASLQDKMSMDLTLPDIKPEDVRTALYGVLALKPEISREEVLLPAEGEHRGYGVTFRATGAEIYEVSQPYREQLTAELLSWIDALGKAPESLLSVKFSMYKGKLIQILAHMDTFGETMECLLYLGEYPGEKTLSLGLEGQKNGEEREFSVMIRTEQDEDTYSDVIHFVNTKNGEKESITVDYQWDLSSGDMMLEILHAGKKVEQRLNLTGEGESFTIRSQNIRPLLNFLLDQERGNPVICNLTVIPGREVTVPEYCNLDQWSAEDMFSLLGGLGGFLGLKFP